MGSVTILLGCGGSGGSSIIGGGTQICGSAVNSNRTVVCGTVMLDGTTNPVPGATVSLKNASGATLKQVTTRAGDGFFAVEVPVGATLIQIDPPNTVDYLPNFLRYDGVIYGFGPNGNAQGGGPCLPPLGNLQPKDNALKAMTLFSSATPPPAYFGCPR